MTGFRTSRETAYYAGDRNTAKFPATRLILGFFRKQ